MRDIFVGNKWFWLNLESGLILKNDLLPVQRHILFQTLLILILQLLLHKNIRRKGILLLIEVDIGASSAKRYQNRLLILPLIIFELPGLFLHLQTPVPLHIFRHVVIKRRQLITSSVLLAPLPLGLYFVAETVLILDACGVLQTWPVEFDFCGQGGKIGLVFV